MERIVNKPLKYNNMYQIRDSAQQTTTTTRK